MDKSSLKTPQRFSHYLNFHLQATSPTQSTPAMRVAIAGSGPLVKYLSEDLTNAGLEVVILTRSHKPFFDGKPGILQQRITDYQSIPAPLSFDYTHAHVDVHLNLIEACKQTPKCKRFIPSEFGGNSEKFPETPGSAYQYNIPIKDALKAQSELEWTVISLGWFLDYLVPRANRYHADVGPLHALDLTTNTMTIPGTGNEVFSVACARDVAKAVALLQSSTNWRPFTYVQGRQTTWLQVADAMKTRGGLSDLKVVLASVNELREVLERNESMEWWPKSSCSC